MKNDTERLRKKNETIEGVTYKSNFGIAAENINQNKITIENMVTFVSAKSIVYFDLETSGFTATDQILEIAARCNDIEFDVYIKPECTISSNASKVTGLTTMGGELYLNNKKVVSIDLKSALLAFRQFLNLVKPALLVAHNGTTFDVPRLLRAIMNNNLQDKFSIIFGFADTLRIFKKTFPERKGPGMLKLQALAEHILQEQHTGSFHEALFDVQILQRLVRSIEKENELFKHYKTYKQCLIDQLDNERIKYNLKKLTSLIGVISLDLLKKVAKENVTYDMLINIYKADGEEAILKIFKEKLPNGKPKITSNKKALDKIIDNLKKNLQ